MVDLRLVPDEPAPPVDIPEWVKVGATFVDEDGDRFTCVYRRDDAPRTVHDQFGETASTCWLVGEYKDEFIFFPCEEIYWPAVIRDEV